MTKERDDILRYAIKDNILVYIDRVQNGIDCGCVCPKCHQKLIAKNDGEKREHHFAHYGEYGKGGKRECIDYNETVKHLLAKEIIVENKKVKFPVYPNNSSSKFAVPAELKSFSKVEDEKIIKGINLIPDICGTDDKGIKYSDFIVTLQFEGIIH